jgi:cell division transport system permease protein
VNLFQALRYFFRDAAVNLVRGWKVSLLAVLTIAVSLTVGGTFLLIGRNLAGAIERWRAEARVVIYLHPGASEADLARLAEDARRAPFAAAVEPVTAAAARERFQEIFPTLGDLVQGGTEEPLPASIEIALQPDPAVRELEVWLAGWRKRPEVSLVDDDREWLDQLATVVALVRSLGLGLGALLLGAAVFTIASVIRLTAYLHREEISVLRLVGATEFYIRGPFYVEGLLQGLLGAGAAVGVLAATFQALQERLGTSLFGTLLATDFLSPRQLAALIATGAAAGLLGAILSLRRESL